MPEVAISARGLSKRYRIGSREDTNDTLGGVVLDLARQPLKNLRRLKRLTRFEEDGAADDVLWALRDVSFDVQSGESVGLIGLNGAGKSTLLKVLCRITMPTHGKAHVYGRVSSLLEVGTGFHPELTGRENVFLNGVILGMTRQEIQRQFDDIVAFAAVEKYIDTPVKRYSSGMRLRLAFSVAAHLEPEILMVDEVLAVGDIRFQRQCLAKMDQAAQQGRTVLYVAHNMAAISRLCSRAILLEGGKIVQDGPAGEVISTYLSAGYGVTPEREWPDLRTAPGGEIARLVAVRVENEHGEVTDAIDIRRPVRVSMEYEVLKSGYVILPNMHFSNEESVYVFVSQDLDPEWRGRRRPAGRYVSTAWIPGNLLSEGMLFVDANLNTLDPFIFQFKCRNAVAFNVVDSLDGDSARGDWTGSMRGAVRPMLTWTTEYTPRSESVTILAPAEV